MTLMEPDQPLSETTSAKRCFLCGKEGLLAIFGAHFGIVVIAMSVDVVLKLRSEKRIELEGTDSDNA